MQLWREFTNPGRGRCPLSAGSGHMHCTDPEGIPLARLPCQARLCHVRVCISCSPREQHFLCTKRYQRREIHYVSADAALLQRGEYGSVPLGCSLEDHTKINNKQKKRLCITVSPSYLFSLISEGNTCAAQECGGVHPW